MIELLAYALGYAIIAGVHGGLVYALFDDEEMAITSAVFWPPAFPVVIAILTGMAVIAIIRRARK